jgi:asparagine synthase (glutamine-hydrolysing)
MDLFGQVKLAEQHRRTGILIEAGCDLGGSAIVIASAKSRTRQFYVYDVFGMIPPPSENDGEDAHERFRLIESGQSGGIGGNKYYGYEDHLKDRVLDNLQRYGLPAESHNIHLIKGLFEDTMTVTEPVALAHIDGDWYDSVMTCLHRIEPQLTKHGVLIIDDYDAWSGCRRAVDEYFKDKQDRYEFIQKSRLHIVRK